MELWALPGVYGSQMVASDHTGRPGNPAAFGAAKGLAKDGLIAAILEVPFLGLLGEARDACQDVTPEKSLAGDRHAPGSWHRFPSPQTLGGKESTTAEGTFWLRRIAHLPTCGCSSLEVVWFVFPWLLASRSRPVTSALRRAHPASPSKRRAPVVRRPGV